MSVTSIGTTIGGSATTTGSIKDYLAMEKILIDIDKKTEEEMVNCYHSPILPQSLLSRYSWRG